MFHLQRWNDSLKHSRPVRWNLKILLYFATCVSRVIITMQCIDQLSLPFYSVSFIPITRKRSNRREIYRFKGQLRQRARERERERKQVSMDRRNRRVSSYFASSPFHGGRRNAQVSTVSSVYSWKLASLSKLSEWKWNIREVPMSCLSHKAARV